MREWIRIERKSPGNQLGDLPTLLVLAEDKGNIDTRMPNCCHERKNTRGCIGPWLADRGPDTHDDAAGIAPVE
ncbi:hypothetical protein BJG92_03567 [Arthrobacter sp. SO5]|nr:hypothetical protein [Arthrobacter sp. SO5]